MKIKLEQILEIPILKSKGYRNVEVAHILNISTSVLSYWIKQLRQKGHKINKVKSPGRPKTLLPTPKEMAQHKKLSPPTP